MVVDDEATLREMIRFNFEREGYRVRLAVDGQEALAAARAERPDLVVLDVMLPGIDGLQVCRLLRAESTVPILLLSAKGEEIDRVLGLELGADDYVTKPFSMAELVGRVRALLRRRELDRGDANLALRRVGRVEVDVARHEARVDDRPVQLTPSEFRLLALLAEHPERVFSRREIMQHLWESDYVGDEHACDVHVSNLRRKVERDPAKPERIVTVRGVGYKLVPA